MAYVAQVAPGQGPVSISFRIGGSIPTTTVPTDTPPGPTSPGVSTPPHKPLPLTGAPLLAGVDLALLLAVAGATLVTVANRMIGRTALRPGS